MKTDTFDSTAIIKALEQHICDNCRSFDTEKAFEENLDCDGDVDVAGLSFSPSRIWKELDPTAFACGTNDYVDGLMRDGQITDEIQGDYYDKKEAESERDSFVSDLESEKDQMETEKTDLENQLEDGENASGLEQEIADKETEIAQKEAEIEACQNHSF